jgi:hypothetical protein
MLYTVLEEAEGAVVEVEQHAHAIALLVGACYIVALLAVAVEGTFASVHEPAVGAFPLPVLSCRVEVGPADADEDHVQPLRQQLQLPIVPALGKLDASCRKGKGAI